MNTSEKQGSLILFNENKDLAIRLLSEVDGGEEVSLDLQNLLKDLNYQGHFMPPNNINSFVDDKQIHLLTNNQELIEGLKDTLHDIFLDSCTDI